MMMPINHMVPDLNNWGVSDQTIAILRREPNILADIAKARNRPPLPPGYCPDVIEVLFEDVPYLRSEQGVLSVLRDCLPDYQPRFIEYRMDEETAFFQVGSDIVVNRLEGIADLMGRISCRS
ncbi:MAG: hypothetical protein F6K00_29645 [Leptolyngbya sp. SIOISBB]|nr:hypothetical protein [Leptolyngbya sp. SIOISBB]